LPHLRDVGPEIDDIGVFDHRRARQGGPSKAIMPFPLTHAHGDDVLVCAGGGQGLFCGRILHGEGLGRDRVLLGRVFRLPNDSAGLKLG